jgi:hypothetical protein
MLQRVSSFYFLQAMLAPTRRGDGRVTLGAHSAQR